MAEDFSRNTARLRTANCFTKSSSPAALAGVESRTIGWTVGRPLRSPFAYGLPLLSRVLCRSQRQVQPDAMASLGDEYAGSTLACSRSFLPSDSACAGPGRWLGQCAYAHCLCR